MQACRILVWLLLLLFCLFLLLLFGGVVLLLFLVCLFLLLFWGFVFVFCCFKIEIKWRKLRVWNLYCKCGYICAPYYKTCHSLYPFCNNSHLWPELIRCDTFHRHPTRWYMMSAGMWLEHHSLMCIYQHSIGALVRLWWRCWRRSLHGMNMNPLQLCSR